MQEDIWRHEDIGCRRTFEGRRNAKRVRRAMRLQMTWTLHYQPPGRAVTFSHFPSFPFTNFPFFQFPIFPFSYFPICHFSSTLLQMKSHSFWYLSIIVFTSRNTPCWWYTQNVLASKWANFPPCKKFLCCTKETKSVIPTKKPLGLQSKTILSNSVNAIQENGIWCKYEVKHRSVIVCIYPLQFVMSANIRRRVYVFECCCD